MKILQQLCFVVLAFILFAGAANAQTASETTAAKSGITALTKREVFYKGNTKMMRLTDANGVVTEKAAPSPIARTDEKTLPPGSDAPKKNAKTHTSRIITTMKNAPVK